MRRRSGSGLILRHSVEKSDMFGKVELGVEHECLFAVTRNALALQINDMGRHWRGALLRGVTGTPLVFGILE